MSDSTNLYIEDLDDTLYRFLDADDRSKKEVVQAALEREYGGKKKHMAELRVESLESREELLENDIEGFKEELESVREDKRRWQEHMEELDEDEQVYQDRLDELLSDAEDGAVLSDDHPAVSDLAHEHDVTVDIVLEDLQERAEERGNYLRGDIEL